MLEVLEGRVGTAKDSINLFIDVVQKWLDIGRTLARGVTQKQNENVKVPKLHQNYSCSCQRKKKKKNTEEVGRTIIRQWIGN